jgi:hypothetical protein
MPVWTWWQPLCYNLALWPRFKVGRDRGCCFFDWRNLAGTCRGKTYRAAQTTAVPPVVATTVQCDTCVTMRHVRAGGTLNTWRSGDDGRTVAERLQVRF